MEATDSNGKKKSHSRSFESIVSLQLAPSGMY